MAIKKGNMPKTKLLLIEDEEDIADLIKLQANLSGYELHVQMNGLDGLRAVEKEKPDLVILDIMLPGLNGLEVCKKIKNNPKLQDIPVIIISAKSEEIDVVLGLEIGADDYVSKPFSLKILFSRIRAVLRRGKDSEQISNKLVFGQLSLDIESHQLFKKNIPLPITLTEFSILQRMLQSRGKVLTRNQLLDSIPNHDGLIVDRNIDVHVAALRKKLGPNFNCIETVRGVGYRLNEES